MSDGAERRLPLWLPPVLYGVLTLVLFRAFVFSDAMLYGGDTLSLGYMARAFYGGALEAGDFPLWFPDILGGIPFVDALAAGDSLYPPSVALLALLEPYRALGWKLVLHVFAAGVLMFGWVRTLGCSRGAALVSGAAYTVAPFLVTLVHPGHDGKLFVTALAPLMFMAMEWTFRRRGALPYVAVALVVALVILTTHFQLAYFLFGAAGAYYFVRVVLAARGPGVEGGDEGAGDAGRGGGPGGGGRAGSEASGGGPDAEAPPGPAAGKAGVLSPRGSGPRWAAARFGFFLAAAVAGALAAGVQLVPAVEYVTESSRRIATTTAAESERARVEYASSWSMHWEEAASLVVPEFPGNNAGGAAWLQDTYWGRNPIRDNHQYAGLVVLLLAAVGFLGSGRKGTRWTLAGIGVVALLYALGRHTPVWRIAYELLPGVGLFRAPDMVAFLFGFGAVTLSGFGVDRLRALAGETVGLAGSVDRVEGGAGASGMDGGDGTGRVVTVLLALTVALLVGTVLAATGALTSLWTSVVYPDIGPRRLQLLELQEPFIVRGFFLATLLAGLTAGVAWAARKGWLNGVGIVAVLTVLVAVDGGRISAPFVQTLDFDRWADPDPIAEALLERQAQEPPFRVADWSRNAQEVRLAMFGLELATGHHPNDLARYRQLIGMEGSQAPRALLEPNVARLLNVRYLVFPGEAEGVPPLLQTQAGGRVYQSLYDLEALFGAPTLPRARLVGEAVVVPDDRAVETIRSPAFDPATTATLVEEPPIALPGGPVEGEVEWLERGIDRQRLRVRSEAPALLVVADNWYPAWEATVDGEPAPVLRAYHTLRAVPVPAGEHEVVLAYRSGLLRGSLALSGVVTALLLGLGIFSYVRTRGGRASA